MLLATDSTIKSAGMYPLSIKSLTPGSKSPVALTFAASYTFSRSIFSKPFKAASITTGIPLYPGMVLVSFPRRCQTGNLPWCSYILTIELTKSLTLSGWVIV